MNHPPTPTPYVCAYSCVRVSVMTAAQRLRLAAVEKAEAAKVTVVKAAEADAEAKFLAGQVRRDYPNMVPHMLLALCGSAM